MDGYSVLDCIVDTIVKKYPQIRHIMEYKKCNPKSGEIGYYCLNFFYNNGHSDYFIGSYYLYDEGSFDYRFALACSSDCLERIGNTIREWEELHEIIY